MSDLLEKFLADALPILLPFLAATILSLFSFVLERLHPEMKDVARTYRTAALDQLLRGSDYELVLRDSVQRAVEDALRDLLPALVETAVRRALQDTVRDLDSSSHSPTS